MEFVSFHTHTTYSYGDGFGTVEQHVERVADLGMRALGVSEHGNVNSHPALERECRRVGIKPIFGIEAYLGPVGERQTKSKCHITLFAQNDQGYHNLNKIVTQSYLDSYQWPTVSMSSLRKNAEGIIVLSGCSDGLISCSLLGGKFLGDKRQVVEPADIERARRRILWFTDIFESRFFLEVQRFPRLGRTCSLNPAFAELSKTTGVPLIATADVHYPYRHQNEMQKVLHAGRRSGSVAVNEQFWEYDVLLTYPESDGEIRDDLIATGLSESDAMQAIERTQTLAQSIDVELPKAKPLRFKLPPGETAANALKKAIRDGWNRRRNQRSDLAGQSARYNERVKQELKVIVEKDFCDYFLATADLVTWAKEHDITVGPGRGSAAGSVVCYLLGITEIDPLHPTFSRMIFERFIDPNRTDMPDIDIDFDDELRHLIPERAREIYGEENVCNVANHIGYRAKKTLETVSKAYALPFSVFEPIRKRTSIRVETDDRVDDSILDVVESFRSDPKIAALVDEHSDKIRQAIQLEGNEHSMGTHAGGFVVASTPIPEVCPIYTKRSGSGRKTKTIQVIPYEKRDAEHLGLLKMDFLGLKTMGVFGKIREWTCMPLDKLYSLYYEDYATGGIFNGQIMHAILEDDLTGIFQYEGGTTRQVTREVKPTNFDELAACNALSRPGPYYGGQTKEYIAVKNGEKDWQRIHPNFDKHVEWTYGQIVYQEQIMFILRDVAGFDVPTVLRVRKIIGKKLGEHQFRSLEAQFISGCRSNSDLNEDTARAIWSAITTAAGYAFNTAHAYSYALVAWWAAHFKIHDVKHFFAANLAKNGDGKDDLPRRTALLQDAQKHNIETIPISLISSKENWTPGISNVIIPGFMQVPGIAEATASDVVNFLTPIRRQLEQPRWTSLLAVPGLGENTIVKMYEFSLKEDPFNVHRTGKQLEAFRQQCERGDFQQFGLPEADEFLTSSGLADDGETRYVAFVGLAGNVIERDEVESIRQRTGKPVDEIKADLDSKGAPGDYKKATIFAYDEFGEVALRVSRWKYESMAHKIGSIKSDHHIVVAHGRLYSGKANSIQVSSLWILEPD